MKRLLVAGTRPEIIKLSPIIKEFEARNLDYVIFNTNQHYGDQMSEVFYRELELKTPDIWSTEFELGKGITELEILIKEIGFKYIVVVGDTWSVLAGVVAGLRTRVPIAHIEAGLRSNDWRMVEEKIRIIADHSSDWLFPPTLEAAENLEKEQIDKNKYFIVGNTIADAIRIYHPKVSRKGDFILVTMHRPETVDNQTSLMKVVRGIKLVQEELKLDVIFPIHPRTRQKIEQFKIDLYKEIPQVRILDPVSFRFMLYLESAAKLILTDSGGVQEEACILGIPCVTFRISTERPETVRVGANEVCGIEPEAILESAKRMVTKIGGWENPYGDGFTAKKIVDILEQ